MFQNLPNENLITRFLLFEKAPTNKTLYVYAYPNHRIKHPMKSIFKQRDEGFVIANTYNLTAIDFQECAYLIKKEEKIPRVLKSLIKLVIIGKVKHIYVRNIKLLSTKSMVLLHYYLKLLSLYKVSLYDKNGLVNLNHVNYLSLSEGDDMEYIIKMFDEQVKYHIKWMDTN